MTPHCHLQSTPKPTEAHALAELRHPYGLTFCSSSQYDLTYNYRLIKDQYKSNKVCVLLFKITQGS
jgi:hypothetical protein